MIGYYVSVEKGLDVNKPRKKCNNGVNVKDGQVLMDDILKLAKNYSKDYHLKLLPYSENNILNKINFLYDDNWEKQNTYPYEILTYLFDSYYVLPQRPDLSALFCWQAINHSYYLQ